MTRTAWIVLLVLALLAGGTYLANDRGYLRGAKESYAGWAEAQRLERDGRQARNVKPTILDMTKDGIARLVPGR